MITTIIITMAVIITVSFIVSTREGREEVFEQTTPKEALQFSILRLRSLYESTLPRMVDILAKFRSVIISIKKRDLPIDTSDYVRLANDKQQLVRKCLDEYKDVVYDDNISQVDCSKYIKLFSCLLCDYDKMIKDIIQERDQLLNKN